MNISIIQLLHEDEELELYDEMWCPWYGCAVCKGSNCTPEYKFCPDCGAKLKWIQPAKAEEGKE